MADVIGRQLRRRAAAARRMEGGDPWPRQHVDPPLTPEGRAAWASAARHILGDGLTPVIPVDVLREMFRQGGDERALAEYVRQNGGVTAA